MTINEAKKLRQGQTVYIKGEYNSDGTAMRCRVNGKIQTCKTRPNDVKVPIKRGLYEFGYITSRNLTNFTSTEPAKRKPKKSRRL